MQVEIEEKTVLLGYEKSNVEDDEYWLSVEILGALIIIEEQFSCNDKKYCYMVTLNRNICELILDIEPIFR